MTKKLDLIAEKIKERDKLYVSGLNHKKLEQLKKEIDFFYWGIK